MIGWWYRWVVHTDYVKWLLLQLWLAWMRRHKITQFAKHIHGKVYNEFSTFHFESYQFDFITHANKNDGFPLNAQLSKTFWFADFAYCFLPLTLYTPNILCNTAIILESHSEALRVWSIIHWFLFNSLITLCSWQDGKIQLLTIFSTCLHYCRYLAHT